MCEPSHCQDVPERLPRKVHAALHDRGVLPERYMPLAAVLAVAAVTESARAHSYILSKQLQKTCQFWLLMRWLLTFWLLRVYLGLFLTLFSGFVQF